MLGSLHGSTGPPSIKPKTGKPYGPDFPEFSVVDIVVAQRALLESLGVVHLTAVAGPRMAATRLFSRASPSRTTRMRSSRLTAPKAMDREQMVAAMLRRFAKAPGWNGGHHYGTRRSRIS
jgi:homoserine O-acetyltransferase